MSDESPKRDYETARDRLDKRHDDGMVPDEDYNRITEFLDAYDKESTLQATPNGEQTKEYATLKSYCSRYTWVSHRMSGATLVTATTEDINEHMNGLLKGTVDGIKDEGFGKSTVSIYQSALRSFYQYHDDLDVTPDDITLTQPDDSPVDPDDLFDPDDVQAMRDACSNPRDRCLIELLLNTGQRVRALQTLKIKHVNWKEGKYKLNPEADGLKHAEGERPLLGARPYVRNWIRDYHPTNDPEDYVITGLHSNNAESEAGSKLSKGQIRRRLMKIADEAGVEKDVNPHQWRHYAVTSMYRDYDMDLDQIRWNIGHGENSRILETTYRHLKDGERIKRIEEAAGFRDSEESDSPFTPDVCGVCGTSLPDGANLCPQCGETYSPNATEMQNQMDEAIYQDKGTADTKEENEAVDAIKEFVENNPQAVMDLLQDQQ